MNIEVLKLSPVYPLLGAMLFSGARDFTIYHEYAHIVLGHIFKNTYNEEEIIADNMALNCLAYYTQKAIKEFEKSEGELQVVAFYMYAPIFLMELFTVFRILMDKKNVESHPHPFIRKNCLVQTLGVLFKNNEALLKIINEIHIYSSFLFYHVYKQLNIERQYFEEIEMSNLKDTRLVIIPQEID